MKKTADTSKLEGGKKIVPPFSFSKMKVVKPKSEVHPSLGRRGIVVPYDIPEQEKCPRCGK